MYQRECGSTDDRAKIDARMSEIASDRRSSQPIQQQTSGSTFKNPPGAKAWQLIEAARLPGALGWRRSSF